MSRVGSILLSLAVGAAVTQAATITAGSASSSVLTGLLELASQTFTISGPGFTLTGSGVSDNFGPCEFGCSPGNILRFSSIGNGPDGGIAGTFTLNGVSQTYSFGGGFPNGAVYINFDFDLVVPPAPSSCFLPCSVVMTGPFTGEAQMFSFSPNLQFVSFDALGGGTATIFLSNESPNSYFFTGQSFTFLPVPEPSTVVSLFVALAGLFVACKGRTSPLRPRASL